MLLAFPAGARASGSAAGHRRPVSTISESHEAAAIASGYAEMHRPRKYARVSIGRLHDRDLDLLVGGEALHLPAGLQPVVQTAVAAHVVVLQVDRAELRVVPLEPVALAIRGQQAVLRHPIELAMQRERLRLERGQDRLPPRRAPLVLRRVVLALHVLLACSKYSHCSWTALTAPAVGERHVDRAA